MATWINYFTNPPLSSTGTSALTTYLNTQYAAGAGGNFVFLRLNPDSFGGNNTASFNFAAVDNGNIADRPVLTINTVTAVPEPGTVTLMGLGLAGLIGARRRRKQQP